jgi:hypothetical protein
VTSVELECASARELAAMTHGILGILSTKLNRKVLAKHEKMAGSELNKTIQCALDLKRRAMTDSSIVDK